MSVLNEYEKRKNQKKNPADSNGSQIMWEILQLIYQAWSFTSSTFS